MHRYHARVEVAHDGPTEDVTAHVNGSLASLHPSVEESADGSLEVRVAVGAETLMEATISAVSSVWTATGGDPVAVDVTRQAPETESEE